MSFFKFDARAGQATQHPTVRFTPIVSHQLAWRNPPHIDLAEQRRKHRAWQPYPTPPLSPPSNTPQTSSQPLAASPKSPSRASPPVRSPESSAAKAGPRIHFSLPKGRGLYSGSKLKRGDVIMTERPMWTWPSGVSVDELSGLYYALPSSIRFLVQTFTRHSVGQKGRLLDLAKANGIPSGSNKLGLYKIASRINHSCQPNAVWRWDDSDGCLVLTAWTSISIDEEICCSYLDELLVSSADRKADLRALFGFDCACDACNIPLIDQQSRDRKVLIVQGVLTDHCSIASPSQHLSSWGPDPTGKLDPNFALYRLSRAEVVIRDLRLWDALGTVLESRLHLQIALGYRTAVIGTARAVEEHFAISQGPAFAAEYVAPATTRPELCEDWGIATAARPRWHKE